MDLDSLLSESDWRELVLHSCQMDFVSKWLAREADVGERGWVFSLVRFLFRHPLRLSELEWLSLRSGKEFWGTEN